MRRWLLRAGFGLERFRFTRRGLSVRCLSVLGLVGASLAASCGGDAADGPPARVSTVLLTLDTTRADALGCYTEGGNGVTPHLDALRARGVLFDAAYTVAPLTLVAHASMLTGLYPVRHGVRDNGLWALPGSADTLAERAASAGYATGAFLASSVLGTSFGLDQGFAVYDAPAFAGEWQRRGGGKRPAADVVAAANRWLESLDPDEPFFLWVHLFDPHSPYIPSGDAASRAARAAPGYPNARYLGEVADMDAAIGALTDKLAQLGRDDETLVLAVADHGESLMAHGEETHGAFCYEEVLRVPLLLCEPDRAHAGETSDAVVSVVDAFPTLAEAMDLSLPAGVDGRSLLRAQDAERGVYFECYSGFLSYGWSPITGWLDAEGKYLHSSDPELYDLAADARETTNLFRERAEDVERYRASIAELSTLPRLDIEETANLDDDAVRQMASLGYTGVGLGPERLPDPLEATYLPSPTSMLGAYDAMQRGIKEATAGNFPAAERAFAEVLAVNPKNYICTDLYAFTLMQQDRHAEAIPRLQWLVHDGPQKASYYFNLGVCLHRERRFREAIPALERAIELDPTVPRFRQQLEAARRDAGL